MKNKTVLEKAIKILEHIYASKSICKKIVPIKTDLEEGKILEYTYPPEQYYTFDYFSLIYDDMKSLIIDIATPLRQIAESYERYGESINRKIKYTSIGVDEGSKTSCSFLECLSKIIHADSIEYEMENKDSEKCIGYEIGENGWFTGKLHLKGKDKKGKDECIVVDVEKLCFNALIIAGVEH